MMNKKQITDEVLSTIESLQKAQTIVGSDSYCYTLQIKLITLRMVLLYDLPDEVNGLIDQLVDFD